MSALLAALLVAALPDAPLPAGPSRNVVVVVTDGWRPREIFSGADRALMGKAGGVEAEDGLVEKYWRPTPEARRAALMPFLWGTVVRHGQIFGDGAQGSRVRVTNGRRLSYPGYNELFTGVADPRITSNAHPANPNQTVLAWLNQQPALEGQVQVFATWDAFHRIFDDSRSGLDVRAGTEPPFEKDPRRTPGKDSIDAFHRSTTPLFGGNALDAFAFLALQESLNEAHPRVLFLGLGETDEWMHAGRYDLALEAAHRADALIAQLWARLQALPEYRDSTTLLITTDHGRGLGSRDWVDHGAEVRGSDEIWLAALGPGVEEAGVRTDVPLVTQGQLAATIAELLGYDWRSVRPDAAAPIPLTRPPRVSARR